LLKFQKKAIMTPVIGDTWAWSLAHCVAFFLFLRLVDCKSSAGCGRELPASVQRGKLNLKQSVKVKDPLILKDSRNYALYVPKSYKLSKATALVLDFHGFDDVNEVQAREDGLFLAAEREGFLVAYPRGMADNLPDGYGYTYYYYFNSWNGGGSNGTEGTYGSVCGGQHAYYPCYRSCRNAGLCTTESVYRNDFCGSSTCADDVGYVGSLLDDLASRYCIDEANVHATAMSNGAIFLYYLATTEVGTRLASIIPVEGSLMLGHVAIPKVSLPVLDIHGIFDDTVPANVTNSWGRYKHAGCPVAAVGPEGCTVSNDLWYYTPVDKLTTAFAQAAGCSHSEAEHFPVPAEFEGHTGFHCMTNYAGCSSAALVRCTHTVEYNGGHTWPFHEGQPKYKRSALFGDLVWWFASKFGRGRESLLNASDVSSSSDRIV